MGGILATLSATLATFAPEGHQGAVYGLDATIVSAANAVAPIIGTALVVASSLRTPFRKMIYHKGSVTGIQGLADPGSERAVTMIADGKVTLIEITHEGANQLDKDTQIQLWKNVSRLLLRKLSVCLSRESLD